MNVNVLFSYILWDVDPEIFVIPLLDHPVRWYGLSWALGFLIGPLIMFRASAPVRARVRELTKARIPDADAATVTHHLQMVARRMLAPASTEELHAEKKRR